ncbi:protein PLANT CADMIUM RESISTANCE 2-like [Lingula anatina]|uniref:Protein PLANT CADMIUM RESISTANCE 2-like n=1 Tax=Lingula anatina TaxID=7574 RepID=A0A1S3IP07_LINAN|nr:protein PLANT CADMIUM RESISTANCE 2-like [Lingula anatina]|eukprot:XP_013387239.1 protein PLANT CADMIUM RESISTANCE 2-like [Lingula anatina]
MSGYWRHGLCGCFNNLGICIITYFVPCYTIGKNAEAVDESCCLYCCIGVIEPFGTFFRANTRSKIRERQGIPGSYLGDCLMHLFCPFCSLVQEAQEVQGWGQLMMVRE